MRQKCCILSVATEVHTPSKISWICLLASVSILFLLLLTGIFVNKEPTSKELKLNFMAIFYVIAKLAKHVTKREEDFPTKGDKKPNS